MGPEEIKKIKLKIIGIGNGGGNIISELSQRLKGVGFFVVNTDCNSFKKLPKHIGRFQIGQNVTFGLGTGGDPELGEKIAKESKEKIKKILKGTDLCIFLGCLGGGTASGAIPVFCEVSQKLGNLNYGIFTLPFDFEGKKKKEIAMEAIKRIKENIHAFTIIENQRIFQIIDKNSSLKSALSELNKILARNLDSLIELIYKPGIINIDFADIKTILKGRGKLTFLNTAKSKSEDYKEMINKLLYPLFYSYSPEGAKEILFNLTGGKDLTLSTVEIISKGISQFTKSQKIIFGISEKKEFQNYVRITLLATGCQASFLEKSYPKKEDFKKVEKSENQPGTKKREAVEAENNTQIRKNALQVREEMKKIEREMLEREKFFEIPSIFRKQKKQNA